MNYENIILFGNTTTEASRRASKKDLQEILGINKTQFYSTIKYLVSKDMIRIEDDKITINKKICIRGKVTRNSKGVVRVFDKVVKEIYEKSKASEHAKLGLFIKILPYIHYDMNVVCYNPEEELTENIQAYTLTELTKELGYSATQKLKKGLMDIKINGESLMMVSTINNRSMIVVNPKLYYKGNKIDQLVGIINLFKIANKVK